MPLTMVSPVPVMMMRLPPCGGRNQPGAGVGQFDIKFRAQPEFVGSFGNAVHANTARHFIEIDVAGKLERLMQVNRTMPPA